MPDLFGPVTFYASDFDNGLNVFNEIYGFWHTLVRAQSYALWPVHTFVDPRFGDVGFDFGHEVLVVALHRRHYVVIIGGQYAQIV